MSETPTGACCSIIADPSRVDAVRTISDANPDPREDLDTLARLTAFAFKAPICVISLVSDTRVRFVGKFGLDACEVALDESLCTQVICRDGPVEVLNLSTDPELCDHPVAVGPPFVRAYCGQPLLSPEGLNIGAVAVQSPERKSPERVSLITMVSKGPGLMPSMSARSSPASAEARMRSISIG